MKKYFLIIAMGAAIVALFSSCYYDKEDFIYPKITGQGICDTTNVTYSGTVKPIFDNNCKSCHGSGTTYDYDGYSLLSAYLATNSQILLANINYTSSHHMPPSAKLDNCSLKQFNIWIQSGYPNN